MKRGFRAASSGLFIFSLAALAWLLLPDLWTGFHPSARHAEAGALALIFVGASFVCLQLGSGGFSRATLKGVLLGLAFVLWGGEQFLPPGAAVTAIDSAVIAIFVADLGLVIAGQLGGPPR
jgi:hypothetical protein